MKKTCLFILFAGLIVQANAQTKQQIENQITFTKLFGYVRYFHPSDEAAAIDWNRFAIYGSQKVAECNDQQQLKITLINLFSPIAPTLQISNEDQNIKFDKAQLIPSSLNGYKTIAWQHVGVGLINDKDAPYQSARTNRKLVYTPASQKSIAIAKNIDITAYAGMPFILKGRSKLAHGNGNAYCWLWIDKRDKKLDYFNTPSQSYTKTNDWENFELKGVINSTAKKLTLGATMLGNGEFWLDDVDLAVQINNEWLTIYANNFDTKTTGEVSSGLLSDTPFKINTDYAFSIVEDKTKPSQKWASIKSRGLKDTITINHTVFFKFHPQVGEYISKAIGNNLKITMPIALYGDERHTYPAAKHVQFAYLNKQIDLIKTQTITGDSLYTRLADLCITWNVFQHFFPYFNYANTDWLDDLRNALQSAYSTQDNYAFLKTLQQFTAKLKDGHIGVYKNGADKNIYYPPIKWEWVEGKLVIIDVLKDTTKLSKGDIVTIVNGETPEQYFKKFEQYISAATPGWLNYRAQTESLLGEKESPLHLIVLKSNGIATNITLNRSMNFSEYQVVIPVQDSIKTIGNGVVFINIGAVSMKAINKVMPLLKNSRTIICDMRGNTTDNYSVNDFIENLLTKKDTASHWLQTPQIIYPDQEKTIGYQKEGFDMKPRKPHLTAKIIFLIDGQAISWAESYMSLIEHYKLATIIGQPTAGTNGDVNQLLLPGGYSIYFTGLKVVKLDGSQHHGVGTKPDIYVNKTIKGIRENKDEFLEKALEIANQ